MPCAVGAAEPWLPTSEAELGANGWDYFRRGTRGGVSLSLTAGLSNILLLPERREENTVFKVRYMSIIVHHMPSFGPGCHASHVACNLPSDPCGRSSSARFGVIPRQHDF